MTGQAKRLLWLGGLVFLGQRLSGLFVQAYMWDKGGSLPALTRFNLASYVGLALLFMLLAPLVKRGRAVTAFRLGLLGQAIFYLTVLLLGARAGDLLIPLGLLSGAGQGAFWVGQNLLIQQATSPADRGRFMGFQGVVTSAMALVGPLVGGLMITKLGSPYGYQVVFAITALSVLAAWVFSNGFVTTGSDQGYDLREGLRDDDPNRRWSRLLVAHVATGFRDGVLGFLPLVLIYATTGALSMGSFAMVTSAVGLAANWLVGRWMNRERAATSFWLGGALQALAALVLLWRLDYTTLFIYTLGNALFGPLQGVPFMTLAFNGVEGRAGRQMERLVVRELALAVGRVISMMLILGAVQFVGAEPTEVLSLLLVAGAALITPWIVHRFAGDTLRAK